MIWDRSTFVILTIGCETVLLIAFLWSVERRILRQLRGDDAVAHERTQRFLGAVQEGFNKLCAQLSHQSSITMSMEADGTIIATKDGVTYVRTPHGWRFYDAPFTYITPEEPVLGRLEHAHAALVQNSTVHTQATAKARESKTAEKEGKYDA